MVPEGDRLPGGDGDTGILEHDGPLRRVVDPLAGIGGVVGIPDARHGLRQVNDGVVRDIQRAVRAIGSGDGDGGPPVHRAERHERHHD